MGLLPVTTVELASDLPPAELLGALGEAIGDHAGAAFAGKALPDGFCITRANDYRTTLLPVVRGRVAPRGAGSALLLRMRPGATVLVFLGIWLAFLAAVGALAVAWRLRSPANSGLWVAGPLLLGAATWRLTAGVFASEARWTVAHLLERVPALREAAGNGRARAANEPFRAASKD